MSTPVGKVLERWQAMILDVRAALPRARGFMVVQVPLSDLESVLKYVSELEGGANAP